MAAWPLGRGARVGTAASEYGGNARVLARLAAERGWELVALPADRLGRVVDVPPGLDLLTLPQVASQRGVVQPVEALRDSGVPLLLDVAQALGQTQVPAGCAAYVGTSRKWLCGPRGVGFSVVDPAWQERLADPPTLAPTLHAGVRRFEQSEAGIAGRVGLAVAVDEWTPALVPVVQERARQARELLGDAGWQVVEPPDEPSGITTLLAPGGVDLAAVRDALLERGLVVSVVPASRAAELDGPVLRVSTAAWVRPDDLADLAVQLRAASR
jgi:pyridoxal 5-phosphate dependent beta-lyase